MDEALRRTIVDWIGGLVGGEVWRLERSPARRAWRTEQLLAPVVSLFPDRELRPLVRGH